MPRRYRRISSNWRTVMQQLIPLGTFTVSDARVAASHFADGAAVRANLYNWRVRGWIERCGTGYRVTPEGMDKIIEADQD